MPSNALQKIIRIKEILRIIENDMIQSKTSKIDKRY